MSPKVIVIGGPTASGKSALAQRIKEQFGGIILNSDASQMYRGLDIGTAKSMYDGEYCVDFLEIGIDFTIKDFQALGRAIINEHEVVIVVGGSGLYLNALLKDYDLQVESRHDDLEQYTNEELVALLESYPNHPEVHPNNRRRLIRYLERLRNQTFDKPEPKFLYDCLVIKVNPPRDYLYEVINERFDAMIKASWLDEVKQLMAAGVDFDAIKAIGYRELRDVVLGKVLLEDAKANITQQTRRLAKRQITWFKHQLEGITFDPIHDQWDDLVKIIEAFLE